MIKKIKILHILEATIGGTRTHLNYLVRYLNQDKFEVSVLISAQRTPLFHQDILRMKQSGIAVYEVNMVRQINLFWDLQSFIKIYQILKKHKFDIVHTHSSKAGVLGRLGAYLNGVPAILYSPHAFAFQGYSNRISRLILTLIERALGRISTKIVCVSESEQKIARENRIGRNGQLTVIPNAIRMNSLLLHGNSQKSQQNGSEKWMVVGTVGYFRHQKNYPLFLQVAAQVIQKYKPVKFLIVGDGEKRAEIRKRVHSLNLETYIIFTGQVENVNTFYHQMDLFLLTSSWEGLPYSLLEAMASGVPVVATDVPGSRNVIIHQQTGVLVPVNNAAIIADTVVSLLKNPEKRLHLSKNAQQRVAKNFAIETRINDYENLYEKLVGKK